MSFHMFDRGKTKSIQVILEHTLELNDVSRMFNMDYEPNKTALAKYTQVHFSPK